MFWENYVNLCKQQNKTPNKVCSILGFSNATATKWKKGTTPSGDTLNKIADYFNVSVDYLLGKKNKPTADEDDELYAVFQELTKDMSSERMEEVIKYMKYLIATDNEE